MADNIPSTKQQQKCRICHSPHHAFDKCFYVNAPARELHQHGGYLANTMQERAGRREPKDVELRFLKLVVRHCALKSRIEEQNTKLGSRLSGDNKQLRQEISELKAENAEKDDKISELRQMIAEMKAPHMAEKDNGDLKKELEALRTTLKTLCGLMAAK